MNRSGYLTPSMFKDIMTQPKGYKTKAELEQLKVELIKEQQKREQSNRTATQVYANTNLEIESITATVATWSDANRFGDTARTKAKEIALGRFGIYQPEFDSKYTDHGNKFEPEARAAYEAATGYSFPAENFRMISEVYPFIAGVCDGNIYSGQKHGGEIKCPWNPVNHLDNITNQTQWDDYKWQFTGYLSDWMYDWEVYTFISYHPYFPDAKKLFFKDYERNEELSKELIDVLLLFEMEVVRPMAADLEQLFETTVNEQFKY